MLIFVKMQIALGFLVFRSQDAVRGSELGHDEAASAQISNEAAKDGVSHARHGSKHRRRRNLDISDTQYRRNGGAYTCRRVSHQWHRSWEVLAHAFILASCARKQRKSLSFERL